MRRKYWIWLHVLVWSLLIISDTVSDFTRNTYYSYQGLSHDAILLGKYFLIATGFCSVAALCFYGSYLWVAPGLFVNKRYLKALGITVSLYIMLAGWRYVLEFHFFNPVLGFDNYTHPVSAVYYFSNIFWYYYPKYFIYGLMYFFAENWALNTTRQEALKKEKLITELAFLRSQINPHFLFNTINDIYALTYQHSEQAPEALLKLSELLRYMLRDSADNFTPLQSEIDYLNNLIELQRIGAKGNVYINFEIEGDPARQMVAPLLFVAFIENAFKHGILNEANEPINIHLKTTANSINLIVRNKISQSYKDTGGGIGLQNVKRRLELLYPGKYILEISDNQYYNVHLSLNL